MPGPYDTEREARLDAGDVFELSPVGSSWDEANLWKILNACEAAGVEMGDYDERIAHWVARWEPQAVQAIVGWITRAGQR